MKITDKNNGTDTPLQVFWQRLIEVLFRFSWVPCTVLVDFEMDEHSLLT